MIERARLPYLLNQLTREVGDPSVNEVLRAAAKALSEDATAFEGATGTRILREFPDRIVAFLPVTGARATDDGVSVFLTLTKDVAEDLMHALEQWKDER